MPSFDVVSKVQMHEVDNAVLQTSKEIATRYDFRDTGTSIERTEEGIVLRSNSEGRIEAAFKCCRRNSCGARSRSSRSTRRRPSRPAAAPSAS